MISPQPFSLGESLLEQIHRLGTTLLKFQRACNEIYLSSAEGKNEVPTWVAALLDQGKPPELIAAARSGEIRAQVPDVIRPDLILTDEGFAISEVDSVPGGIGATAWMNQTYAALGHEVIGGAEGMVRSFARLLAGGDVIVSEEASDYLPEMLWLRDTVHNFDPESGFNVFQDSNYKLPKNTDARTLYRFFELFDLANVNNSAELIRASAEGQIKMTAPPKPFLEEKLWLALFWSPALKPHWQHLLGEDDDKFLRQHIPYGWVIDPTPLPYFAEFPELGIQDWNQMANFGKAEKQLVLKVSGFSEKAWGSRGVYIGHDLPREDWAAAIKEAIDSFPTNPYILQRFHKAKTVSHPVSLDDETVEEMRGRVRLCPYYFVNGDEVELSGIMATVAPADKKIIHGMRDAAIVPCCI